MFTRPSCIKKKLDFVCRTQKDRMKTKNIMLSSKYISGRFKENPFNNAELYLEVMTLPQVQVKGPFRVLSAE